MKFRIPIQAELKLARNAEPVETYCLNIQKVQSDKITESQGFTFLAQSILSYCLLQHLIKQFYQLSWTNMQMQL